MQRVRKSTATSNSKHTVYMKESVRYIMMLYKARTDKGALAIIGDIEKLLPEFERSFDYDGRKADPSIIEYDMLKNFLGIRQITPNDNYFYDVLIEFIKRQERLKDYHRLLSYPETAVMFGDVYTKLSLPPNASSERSSNYLNFGTQKMGLMVFPTHDIICFFSRNIPGTNYNKFRIVAFYPSYITSSLNIPPVFINRTNIALYEKVFVRIFNSCTLFAKQPYFADFQGIITPLRSYESYNYTGLAVRDDDYAYPIWICDSTLRGVCSTGELSISLVYARDKIFSRGHERFYELLNIADSSNDVNGFPYPGFASIPLIIYDLAEIDTFNSLEFREFFDSMLPNMR